MRAQRTWNPFTTDQWIAWLGATAIAAASMTIFFYKNFESKEDTQEYKMTQEKFYSLIEKRLDRIEHKLDQFFSDQKK